MKRCIILMSNLLVPKGVITFSNDGMLGPLSTTSIFLVLRDLAISSISKNAWDHEFREEESISGHSKLRFDEFISTTHVTIYAPLLLWVTCRASLTWKVLGKQYHIKVSGIT